MTSGTASDSTAHGMQGSVKHCCTAGRGGGARAAMFAAARTVINENLRILHRGRSYDMLQSGSVLLDLCFLISQCRCCIQRALHGGRTDGTQGVLTRRNTTRVTLSVDSCSSIGAVPIVVSWKVEMFVHKVRR